MNNFSQLLKDHAEYLRSSSPTEIAVEHLKQAGYDEPSARKAVAQHLMEKEASEYLVTSAGIDIEQAVAMVKAANVNVADLANFQLEAEEDPAVDLLEKAAQFIESLEAELNETQEAMLMLNKEAEQTRIDQVQLPTPLVKAAEAGVFTNEDLAALKAMDKGLLTKVASTMDDKPWEMGQGYGIQRPKSDPLLDFILG